MPPIYSFVEDPPGSFSLYEHSEYLITFTRDSFRASMESFSRSSNWVGSILRLFLKQYPPIREEPVRTQFDRAIFKHGENGLAEYLRSKGYRVTQRLDDITDTQIISFLESQGYVVQGLLEGAYYDSNEKSLKTVEQELCRIFV